ncbi:MAG: ABC transporter ATP-binding protein [Bacillota bacterium]
MILEVNNVHTYYGESHILQDVNLKVEEKQVIALLGRNGVGKTTLVRSIMGLTPPKSGSIVFRGAEITKLASHLIAQKGLGLVPQGRMVFPSLSVLENLQVAYRRGGGADGKEWNVDTAFEVFPRLKQRINNRGNELSGGEQQMLAIARALVTNPYMLIMDEPTEGLAPVLVNEVKSLLQMIKKRGYPIFLVEQKLGFALDVADKVYIMSKGTVVYDGLPEELDKDEAMKREHLGI